MSPETFAHLTLTAYVTVALLLIVRQAVTCDGGPVVWLLYCLQRTYAGLWFHWRANRRCPFPQSGPGLIVANHRSPVDPMMIWANSHLTGRRPKIRVISFLMAREYYELRGLHWLFKSVRSIPVDRTGHDMTPVRAALRMLQQGGLVAVFPEGGINLGEGLRPASPGIAWLALRSQAPVYPVFIHNSPQGRSMVEPFVKGGRVRVTYGRPIDLSAYYRERLDHKRLIEVTDVLMARLAQLGGTTYGAVDSPGESDVLPLHVAERATG